MPFGGGDEGILDLAVVEGIGLSTGQEVVLESEEVLLLSFGEEHVVFDAIEGVLKRRPSASHDPQSMAGSLEHGGVIRYERYEDEGWREIRVNEHRVSRRSRRQLRNVSGHPIRRKRRLQLDNRLCLPS